MIIKMKKSERWEMARTGQNLFLYTIFYIFYIDTIFYIDLKKNQLLAHTVHCIFLFAFALIFFCVSVSVEAEPNESFNVDGLLCKPRTRNVACSLVPTVLMLASATKTFVTFSDSYTLANFLIWNTAEVLYTFVVMFPVPHSFFKNKNWNLSISN